ncbi:replication protein A 70 kDa DNA-binding subunit B-like [Coffea arabica]|uniref:Replication protein A 70 kDa DNA-binding subunit B-like n=1 Tax=Coffea arabica TaxID=13443 RepID=A0ABM4W7R7_COFAR
MARRYLPVNEVVEGVKGWTVLAQVVERGHVQLSRGARPVNYRRFLLTDSEGTKVSAVIYGSDIRFFAGILMPFSIYYISSAALRKAESRYKVSDYPYSWVIHNRTLVEEYVEQVLPVIPCHFELTAFAN